jgi:parvulin-like peptidyl-prolyl isomerase
VAKKRKEEKPKEYTRRQLSHFKKQKRRQRIIFFSGIAIIAAIVVIIVAGWYIGEYRPVHRTVIKIGDAKFSAAYFVDILKVYGVGNQNQPLTALTGTVQNTIVENELVKQAARELGITVSDEEVKQSLKDIGAPETRIYIDIFRTETLKTKLKDEYFGPQVPVSDNQVNMMAVLVESGSVANEVRDKVVNGDNFTELAKEYGQNYYAKNEPYGDFGWHPAEVLKNDFETTIPIDYAVSAQPGDVSLPLSDNTSSKQLGYWLINVLSMSENETAGVQALLLSSRDEALEIRARLESGDNLSALADEYSQYSPSRENHGDLGTVTKPVTANTTAISQAFDGYVFDPATETGKWSEPIQDTYFWTKGGDWIVKLVDKGVRELRTSDRAFIINQLYDDWLTQLEVNAVNVDTSGLTDEVMTWIIDRATKELQQSAGG